MDFKGLCANCMQNARLQRMHTIDTKLCSHLMLQNSFRNIEQNNYRNCLDDRLELWPGILSIRVLQIFYLIFVIFSEMSIGNRGF